ncbi:hypothetical protein GCM10023115_56410 [Pontixanthobacter gangjinensis]|uniref:Transglutaminase-like cysteine proteinase BTLCP n=1 Tax=Pontixanthobacter gangjinensis TaxID=1028742 RepID=A0A6I4SQ33_9SPHN|nr:transglutaminase-like cysteine peptidase [Pontixanthobacter gangjinensis]MXO57924.1 hypothetical protein [Pontixanthobacter gangjinensis]
MEREKFSKLAATLGCLIAFATGGSINAAAQQLPLIVALPSVIVLPSTPTLTDQAVCAVSSEARDGESQSVISKGAIIAGGVSKLEQMRLAQQGVAAGSAVTSLESTAPLVLASTASSGLGLTSCLQVSAKVDLPKSFVQPRMPGDNDILGSQRIRISKTTLDAKWDRVRNEGVSRRTAQRFINRGTSDKLDLIDQVNSRINREIRFVEDARSNDQWETASRTIRRKTGDCEDIAIAKMQVLSALGIAKDKMTLTIARDLVRGRDHSVLIVELEGKRYLLDNESDQLLDGRIANDYRPIFSYSGTEKWIHGYTAG